MNESDLLAWQAKIAQKYQQTASEMADTLRSPEQEGRRRIAPMAGRSFLVLCGPSGCGKTRSIGLADQLLSEGVAECRDLYQFRDGDAATEFLKNDDSEYIGATHVVYTLVKKDIGAAISASGVCSVIFME